MSRYTSIIIVLLAVILFDACKKDKPEETTPQLEIPETVMADLGDTIQLTGKNLPSDVRIIIDGNLSEILRSDENAITFVMPDELPKAVSTVNIFYPGKEEGLKYAVTLNPPQISSISANASYGDTLTISGDHFDKGPYWTQVKFDDLEARVTSVSKKKLKVIVPSGISTKEPVISITSQHQTVQAALKFNLPPPVFTRVPDGAYTNTPVVITGKNFSPVPGNNHLFLDGVEIPVTMSSTLQLEFMLPKWAYPKRKVRISYKIHDYEIVHPADFIIKDAWIKVNQNLPFSTMGAAVTINDHAYTVAVPYASQIEDQDYKQYLWRFDQTDFSWQKTSLPFQPAGSHITTNGSKLYLYEPQGNKLREYDPASNQWTTKADFPGMSRQAPTLFSIDNKIYVGLGSYYVGNELTAANDFYAFEPGSNKWSKIADYPHPHEYTDPYTRMGTTAFVVNKIAYVPCMVGPIESNSYKYDPNGNKWTQIANFPGSRWFMTGFSYDQKGYVFNGYGDANNTWRYDPTTDKWTVLTSYATGRELRPGIAFMLKGRIYVSGVVDQIDDWPLYELIGHP